MVFLGLVIRRTFSIILIAFTGCAMTVRPPEAPDDAVHVVLVDYGRHSSLILPRRGGGSVEYAYGEWNWYALMKDRWHHAFATMLWPTQGTLGRRYFEDVPESPKVSDRPYSEEHFLIAVERARARALLDRLNDRFDRHIESRLYNRLYRLEFVHDDESYCGFDNCNHAVAGWLEDLGCEVKGCRFFSDFRMRSPAGR